jgi:DNA-binding SARP family transcriptional activator/ActR/RegA family two-component response regulator
MVQQTNNILVVEDRDDWQDILCTTLAQQGYVPHAAVSYDEALAALAAGQFGLAVIDPVLDKTNRFNRDGISVIQRIRETRPSLPVIILTGSLTHDMELSLQHLYPDASVLFKERWDTLEFNQLVRRLIARQPPAASVEEIIGDGQEPGSRQLLVPPSAKETTGRPRVLLVENRQDWQQIVAAILDESGYFWRIAGNAQEALHEMEQEGFHLVILDLKLQRGDLPLRSNEGWLLLDYLVEKHPKTKVLILSGKAGPTDVAELLTQYPVIGFISKQDYRPEAIIEAVERSAQSPTLRIQSFGQFQIWRNGQAIGIWDRPQAEAITKMLLVRCARGGRAVAADELITRLWPEADETSGRKKLLPLISNARHTIEPDIEPRDSHFILRSTNGYYFDVSECVDWDLMTFREHLRLGVQLVKEERWAEAIAQLEKGRALYRGDFLAEDRYADWAIGVRREITADYCSLLVRLADAYAALEQYAPAVESCETALTKDPLLESVYRRLMIFYYCQGEKGQALKVYRDCLKLFEELFGESPTPATRQLHQSISSDESIECPPSDQFYYPGR